MLGGTHERRQEHRRGEVRETPMQGLLTWSATAALFASLLSGCAAQAEVSGSPAGKGTSAGSSPIDPPPQRRLQTILESPSPFDSRGQANHGVSEAQAETNTPSPDYPNHPQPGPSPPP